MQPNTSVLHACCDKVNCQHAANPVGRLCCFVLHVCHASKKNLKISSKPLSEDFLLFCTNQLLFFEITNLKKYQESVLLRERSVETREKVL